MRDKMATRILDFGNRYEIQSENTSSGWHYGFSLYSLEEVNDFKNVLDIFLKEHEYFDEEGE